MLRKGYLYTFLFPLLFLTLYLLHPPEKVPPNFNQHPPEVSTSHSPTLATNQVHYYIQEDTYRIVGDHRFAENIALLTFDDGPSGNSTRKLLDVLDQHHAKAIWFVNGRQVAQKQRDGTFRIIPQKAQLLREIANRGHMIGNHAWGHANLRKLSIESQREEIESTSKIIQAITGKQPSYFRPPFGAVTEEAKRSAQRLGMQTMNWSVGSLDWEPSVYQHPNRIRQQVLNTIHNGANILFHDRSWTADQLDEVLTALERKAYHFVLPSP